MAWYDANNLIDPNRTLLWTFASMRAQVRKLVGLVQTYQLSDAEIDAKLNNFYQNILPLDLKPEALNSWYTFNTQASVDTQILPDGVLDLRSPVTFGGYDALFTKNDHYFFSVFPETQSYTAQRPSHVLLRGRLLILRPQPDAVYQFKAPATIKPTAFTQETDTPMQDQWGMYIAYGAAIDILSDKGDMKRIGELSRLYQKAKNFAESGDLMQMTHERNTPGW